MPDPVLAVVASLARSYRPIRSSDLPHVRDLALGDRSNSVGVEGQQRQCLAGEPDELDLVGSPVAIDEHDCAKITGFQAVLGEIRAWVNSTRPVLRQKGQITRLMPSGRPL